MNAEEYEEAVTRIVDSDLSDSTKMMQLYAIGMLNYRQPVGDVAFTAIEKLVDNPEIFSGFLFITGFLLSGNTSKDGFTRLMGKIP
jgi:hypothetical protein